MFANNNLKTAMAILQKKCNVIPEQYTLYNKGFLFLAYPPNCKDKSNCLSPYYLVDIRTKTAGPFSPAFDLDGFFNAVEKMNRL